MTNWVALLRGPPNNLIYYSEQGLQARILYSACRRAKLLDNFKTTPLLKTLKTFSFYLTLRLFYFRPLNIASSIFNNLAQVFPDYVHQKLPISSHSFHDLLVKEAKKFIILLL